MSTPLRTRGEIPPQIRQSVLLWVGCLAGALEENEYRTKLASAGFENIEIKPTRIYRVEDAREFLCPARRRKVHECIRAGRDAQAKRTLLRPNLLPVMEEHARTLQLLVPMHRKLGSLNNGRGNHELQGPSELHRLQCREPSLGYSSSGHPVNRHCYGTKCVPCYKPDH